MLLDRLLDLEKKPAARRYDSGEYRLDLFEAWLDALAAPHRTGSYLHLAGTKGKGSTAAICEGILRGLRFPTTLFTSPHLTHYGQRYRFDGRCWTPEQFETHLNAFEQGLTPEQRHGLESDHSYRTVFEVLTALAFTSFKQYAAQQLQSGRTQPTISILETGLGGRLDCTNVVDPRITVITTLGIDHSHLLGDTIEKITAEKAGIIKPGRPVVVARQQPELFDRVWPVLTNRAEEVGAPIIRAWEHNPVETAERHPDGMSISMRLPDGQLCEGILPLRGLFQLPNVEAAVAACWYLTREEERTPTPEQIVNGWSLVSWPGRLEVLPGNDGQSQLILDGAHCPLSARALGRELREMNRLNDTPWTLLFGMQGDKAAQPFLQALIDELGTELIDQIIVYPVSGPRGANPQQIARIAQDVGLKAQTATTIQQALETARKNTQNIAATGSLYCLEQFRTHWR